MILAKTLISLIGAALYLVLFVIICSAFKWDVPTWGYLIVCWMGHSDLYNFLTFKKEH